MRLGPVDTAERVAIVAEIGNNHEGDVEVALRIVREAAAAGADAVKLQTYRTESFVRPADAERFERMKRFELEPGEVARVAALARELGLAFVSTPLDLESVALLAPLVDALKVASGDNDFAALLDAVAATGKPVILSAGMADLPLLERAVARLRAGGAPELAVLHCTSAYPAPDEDANLAAIPLLAAELGTEPGYSDHTLGSDAAAAAVALGARIVEKHVTLDKAFSDFRDHALAADPPELRELVERVRRVERLVGRAAKELQPSEVDVARAARRSIVAAADLAAGHVVAEADLAWLRPADGLPPGEEHLLLGRRLVRAVGRGEPIHAADVA